MKKNQAALLLSVRVFSLNTLNLKSWPLEHLDEI
jgi:hypothetical protein